MRLCTFLLPTARLAEVVRLHYGRAFDHGAPGLVDGFRLLKHLGSARRRRWVCQSVCSYSFEFLYRISFSYLRDGVKDTTKTAVWKPRVYRNALSTENGNPFVSRSLVRREAVDLFHSIAVLAGQNKHVVMFWRYRDYEVRGRNPQELLREGFVIRARPPPQCYLAALDVASCSQSSCPTAQMRPQLYIAAGLAVGRPRARVGGRGGGHGNRAAAGCCVIAGARYIFIVDIGDLYGGERGGMQLEN